MSMYHHDFEAEGHKWDTTCIRRVIADNPDRRKNLKNVFYRPFLGSPMVEIRQIRLLVDFGYGYKYYRLIAKDRRVWPMTSLREHMLGGSTYLFLRDVNHGTN